MTFKIKLVVFLFFYSYFFCFNSIANDNLEEGTLLFMEDFGGNNVSDPDIKETGIDQVSGYKYIGPNQTTNKNCTYFIRKKGYPNNDWHVIDDHTYWNDYTRGYMLQVDASLSPGVFYKKRLDNLCTGIKLYFSVYALNCMELYRQIYLRAVSPNISFFVRDAITGKELLRYDTGPIPNDSTWYDSNISFKNGHSPYYKYSAHWRHYGASFTVPAGIESVIFSIENNTDKFLGADLAIDDIGIYLCSKSINVSDVIACEDSSADLIGEFNNDGSFEEPLEYKWQKAESSDSNLWNDIPMSNSNILHIDKVNKKSQGYYRMLVSAQGNLDKVYCHAVSKAAYLKVDTVLRTLIRDSLCEGNKYDFFKNKLSVAGEYSDTLKSINQGCDSILTLNLKFLKSYNDTIKCSICENDTYKFGGSEYSISGIYKIKYVANNGCDSIFTLELNVNKKKEIDNVVFVPYGQKYKLNGIEIKKSGEYSDTLKTSHGCDSVVIVNVTLGNNPVDSLQIPEGFSPNGDGINDFFVIGGGIDAYSNSEIIIFNRWGVKLFDAKPIKPWDGKNHEGRSIGTDLPVGTYYYIIKLDGDKGVKHGYIYLNK